MKATTTNPATRFCTMAATPGERMNKATGAKINAGAALPLEPTMGLGLK